MTNTNRPYSPSPEYRYFLYDPNDGYAFYRTPEEREIAAKSLIEDYLVDGEWSEQVVDIYAGEATHLVSEVERIDKVGELDENGEYWLDDDVDCKCNYDLRPLVPTPPANHFPGATEMVAPPAEGEAADMAVEQLQHIIHREPWATWLRPGGCLESAHCELTDLLSSAIAADRARRPTPPAEGEAHLLAAWMYRLADERTRSRRRGIRPNPSALTRTGTVLQQQAAVLQQQAAELAECREALRRVRLEQRIPGGGW